jgi:hypothetical protein
LDTVVPTHSIEEYGLKPEGTGAVVRCYENGLAF